MVSFLAATSVIASVRLMRISLMVSLTWRDVLTKEIRAFATDKARRTVEEAIRLMTERSDSTLQTVHLLISLLRGRNIGSMILNDLKVSFDACGDRLYSSIKVTTSETGILADVPLALAEAEYLMKRMGYNYFSHEHILLGLTTAGTDSSIVLAELGVTRASIETRLKQYNR